MSHLTDSELLRLASGEMPSPAREPAECHARQCPRCSARLAELTRTWELLASWRLPDETADLSDRIVAAASAEARSGPRSVRAWPAARTVGKAAAAVLLAAAAGYGAGRACRSRPAAEAARATSLAVEDEVSHHMHLDTLGAPSVGLAEALSELQTKAREISQ